MKEYAKQVNKEHYSFDHYFFPGRWMSYYYQAKEIFNRKDINSVLDIGPGTAFLKSILEIHRPEVEYKTIDVAEDVKPDIIGSVTKMPLPDSAYDAVCAFQVLEHIEYDDVPQAVGEMFRVAKKYVILSVPHFGPSVEFLLKLPFLRRLRFAFKIPYSQIHEFKGQHYWELGKRGYPPAQLRTILEKFGKIENEYVPFENQYHHFFILSKHNN